MFLTTKNLQLTTSPLLPRPPRITARLSQLVFEVIQPLPQLIEFLPLGVDFRRLLVDIGAVKLLPQSFLRVRVIFQLRLFQLASQNIEFLLDLRNLVALGLKPLSPGRLAIRIFGLGRVPGLSVVPGLSAVSSLGSVSRRLHCRRGRRSTGNDWG